jgi:phage terminase large subunit-like protein
VSGLVVISDGLVIVDKPLGYEPRPQFIPFHLREQRRAVIVAHRRAGKTVACINDLIDHAIRLKRNEPRFAYVAPLYKQAKSVAWDYLKKYGLMVPGAVANESELRVDLPPQNAKQGDGARIRLHGADNPDALRGPTLTEWFWTRWRKCRLVFTKKS